MQLEELKKPRIIILCGGPFSFQSIGALAYEKYLSGIVIATQEQSIARSLQLECEQSGVPFLSLSNRNEINLLSDWLQKNNPDAIFSICFPYLLPSDLLNAFSCPFINFHTGPLPTYRGPMPIFEVLRNEEKYSAVTAHLMDEGYDSGQIIYSEEIPIVHGETFTSLARKMAECCSMMALNLSQMLEYGSKIITTPQDTQYSAFFPFPNIKDLHIDWENMSAKKIISLINAGNGWNNGAITNINENEVHLISVAPDPIPSQITAKPGTLIKLMEDGSGEISCINNEKIRIHQFGSEDGIFNYSFLLEMNIREGDVCNSIIYP